jgi:hypothetical protein
VRRIIGIGFLILAFLQFGYRGVQRVHSEIPLWDFDSVYAAARTWVHGGDPYDLPAVLATWHGCGVFSHRDASYFATVYPPNSLCLMVPFAVLPAAVSMLLWLVLILGLLVLQFAALVDLAGLRWRDPRVLILVGASLASAPFQFGILSGQLSLPAISLCIIAFWCGSRNREVFAGILLGLACALKPQIGVAFVAYYLLARRWTVSALAIGLSAAVVAVALLAMRISHVDWFSGWTHSIALTTQAGSVNDYGWVNNLRDEIMDLKMLLISGLHDTRTLRIGVEAVVLALGVWYLGVFRAVGKSGHDQLLVIGGLSALSFLPVYHRVYDAALLTTVLAWALAELDGPRRRYAAGLLVPLALFLVPFDVTSMVARRLPVLDRVSQTAFWETLIAPNYAWGLLGITVVALVTMSRAFGRVAVGRVASGNALPGGHGYMPSGARLNGDV